MGLHLMLSSFDHRLGFTFQFYSFSLSWFSGISLGSFYSWHIQLKNSYQSVSRAVVLFFPITPVLLSHCAFFLFFTIDKEPLEFQCSHFYDKIKISRVLQKKIKSFVFKLDLKKKECDSRESGQLLVYQTKFRNISINSTIHDTMDI